jgi:preprotein translocase YajC subunit
MLITMLPLILLIVIMYFMLIKPQKKREKQVNQMRSNLHVGDDIITIGGICGKIVKTKEDSIIIQVGADKIKFEMMRWSVSKVVDTVEKKDIRRREAEYEEADEEQAKARPQRLQRVSEEPAEELEEANEVVEEAAGEAEEDVEAVSEAAEEAEAAAEEE